MTESGEPRSECANCFHSVTSHGSKGCLDGHPVGTCPCLFDYGIGAGTFNGEPDLHRCRAYWAGGSLDRPLRCELQGSQTTRHVQEHQSGDRHWSEDHAFYPNQADLKRIRDLVEDEAPAPASETQVGGDHYRQNKVQPWDIVDDWGLDFYRGNALKYLLRAGRKGPAVEDLKKAKHYIEKCIEREEGK